MCKLSYKSTFYQDAVDKECKSTTFAPHRPEPPDRHCRFFLQPMFF